MLPEPLCKDLCSLIEGEQRNTVSVFYTMSSDGESIEQPVLRKTKIRSKRQYTYDEVQSILSGYIPDDNTFMLQTLSRFAKVLKRNRMKVSSLARTYKIDVLEDDDIETRAKDAYELVSEWMIFTNIFIANQLSKMNLYMPIRSQNPPDFTKVQQWMKDHGRISFLVMALQNYIVKENSVDRYLSVEDDTIRKLRYIWLMPSQKWLWAKLLDKKCTIEEKMSLIATDCLHPLQALAFDEWTNFQPFAEYRCVPSVQTNDLNHFGLQVPYYVHFTSPMRRFIDLVVQRIVVASLDGQTCPYTKEELDEICNYSNEAYKRSMQFQRNAKMFLLGHTLQKRSIRVHAFIQEVSATEIILYIPGFRSLPNSCISLPLNLLGSNQQPEMKRNQENGKMSLQLHWEKRIYSIQKEKFQREHHVKCQKLNPHSKSEFHHMAKWANIVKSVINDGSNMESAIFDPDHPNVTNHRAVPECYDTVDDVNSETDISWNIKHSCEFTMTFSFGQVLALQITGEPDQGMVLPAIQLVDMTKSIKMCLQHTNDPVGKLAHYATKASDEWMNLPRKRRRDRQENRILLEYIRTWMAIFHMETATVAAMEDSITINDISVTFESNRKGYFKIPSHFCLVRDIEFSKISSVLYTNQPEVEEYSPGSDFLCIKCELSKSFEPIARQSVDKPPEQIYIWIGHAKINEVDYKDKLTRVGFILHKESQDVPANLTQIDTGVKCSVEVLPKPDVDKRIEVILRNLELASPLAKAVTLRRPLPKLGKDRRRLADKTNVDIKCKGLHENNQSQRKAIKNALNSSFSIIQGPPGTGKTLTGIKLVYLFCLLNKQWWEERQEKKRVIFTGPSNKSVDLVAISEVSRADSSLSSLSQSNGVYTSTTGDAYSSRAPGPTSSLLGVCRCLMLCSIDGEKFAEAIKTYDEKFSKPDYKVDAKEINDYKKKINAAIQHELQKHDVIFCTTAVATSSRFLTSLQGTICQLIIDEAGMCTEPETISTIVATHAEQVVLIGDHKQLRPIVLCQKAANLGLEKSLFEEYADKGFFLTFLDMQYRMHERICDFPSRKFYDGKLKTAPTKPAEKRGFLRIFPNENVPLALFHVEGEEISLQYATEIGNEASCSNYNEVQIVVKIFQYLVNTEKILAKDICIMSQYNAQCHELRHALKDTKDVQVYTVFASQGSEWDYVIFSTVRSLPEYRIEPKPTLGWCIEALGFITDEHQINVALTRAKKGLIIIGKKVYPNK
ncbi:hypothetical protein FSP39_005530 [Pinctada imbricata]|uniref:RNB domain-containing protein n=1 Tax=Pinctada imbricata TaxID=66713 RepID=A0AA88XP76_PINIB|nr:hypothetical protein FSP39_005530 [Pinctada imbricata]